MTNRLALAIVALVVAALLWDGLVYDSAGTLFLLRRGFALLQWMAFWR